MPTSKYWQDRFIMLQDSQLKKGEKYAAELEKEYQKATAKMEQQIESWYQRFANNNQISLTEAKIMLTGKQLQEFKWDVFEYIKYGEENALDQKWMKELENASARVHISRLESLKIQMQQQIEVLYGNQLDDVDDLMRGIYEEGFYHTAFEIQRGFNVGYQLHKLTNEKIQAVVSKPWTTDNKTFSDRIWGSKQDLINQVQTGLTQGMIRGDSPAEAVKDLAAKMKVKKNQAGRLIMTESAFFASAAQRDAFNTLDVERFEVVATLDNHTSEICQDLDGHVEDMANFEVGSTAPPFHVWCRSTTVPYFDDNYGERAARGADGKTYFIPSDMKYHEWKKDMVLDPSLAKQFTEAKKALNAYPIKTYTGIWKDAVTTADFSSKQSSIPAKKAYFQQQINMTSDQVKIDQFNAYIADLDEFEIQGSEYAALEQVVLDAKKALKDAEKQAKLLTQTNSGIMIDNPYTEDRKNAAYWFIDTADADAVLRDKSGEVWINASALEKDSAYKYSGGSGSFNRPLRGYQDSWSNFKGMGKVDLNHEGSGKNITALADLIDRSEYDFDIWLQRGVETESGVASFLQISVSDLNKSQSELENLLIGKVVKDEAFLSTAVAKGKGFKGTIFNVYAPRGTKMIYAEPFSAYGHGDKRNWDGIKKQSSFGYEAEMIIQKGQKYEITKVTKSNGKLYIDIDVIQE